MATDSGAFIIADPLIPCRTSPGGAGFVFALASSALKFACVTKNTETPREIQVTLSAGAHCTLQLTNVQALTLEGDNEEHRQFVAEIQDATGKVWLRDALGKLRKNQHIAICADQDVETSDRYTGFSDYHFLPQALPELNLQDVQTKTSFLGREFAAPMLITGMTGGIERGAEINRRLALAAQNAGIPMGVGSQRIALDDPNLAAIFAVKQYAPKVFLIGNIGAAQLVNGLSIADCQRALDMIDADALAVHVNVLQESVQVEGDHQFHGLLKKLATLKRNLAVPMIVKEVGGGIDPVTAKRLDEIGIDAIDTGGRGGTSWGFIEGKRSNSRLTQHAADTFRDWGIPTAYALRALHQQSTKAALIATGGIRSGLDIAKAIALGASMTGIGLPLFRAALLEVEHAVDDLLATYLHELKITMLCTGAKTLTDLREQNKICRGLPLAEAGHVDKEG